EIETHAGAQTVGRDRPVRDTAFVTRTSRAAASGSATTATVVYPLATLHNRVTSVDRPTRHKPVPPKADRPQAAPPARITTPAPVTTPAPSAMTTTTALTTVPAQPRRNQPLPPTVSTPSTHSSPPRATPSA